MAKSALVVDDDLSTLELADRWLTPRGYQVTPLADFRQARELLRTSRFDLLVTDVRLGQFNGLQLAIEARSADPTIPIVVMSGWPDTTVTQEAALCKAVVLLKPFTAESLAEAIQSARP